MVKFDGGGGGDTFVKARPSGGDGEGGHSSGSGSSLALALLGSAIMIGTLCFPVTRRDLIADTFDAPAPSAASPHHTPAQVSMEGAATQPLSILMQQNNPQDWESSLRSGVELVGHTMSMPSRMAGFLTAVGGALEGIRM
jgi:hypothetical protein